MKINDPLPDDDAAALDHALAGGRVRDEPQLAVRHHDADAAGDDDGAADAQGGPRAHRRRHGGRPDLRPLQRAGPDAGT